MGSRDQRRDPRAATNQQIWLEGQESRITGQAQNISKSGMFVVAQGSSPAIGSEVAIKFDDPQEGKVEIKMEVVWRAEDASNGGVGLRAVQAQDKSAFERVVIRHLEEQQEDEKKEAG